MSSWPRWLSVALLLVVAGASEEARAGSPGPGEVTAFVDVHVRSMQDDRLLKHQTVLVADGRITAIGRKLAIPPGARRVESAGRLYLAPGLADMHTHSDSADDMAVYLSHGVTTVLNLGEASNAFVGRTRLAANRGDLPSPHIYAALAVDGSPEYAHLVVATPEDARATMQVAAANGYRFLKVYTNLSREVFETLATEARKHRIGIAGHGLAKVGIERQFALGQQLLAHLEEFFYAYFVRPAGADDGFVPNDAAMAEAVAMTKRSGAFVTADLVTYQAIADQIGKPAVVRAHLDSKEALLLSPADRLAWVTSRYQTKSADLAPRAAFLKRFTKTLADAGVPLVVGTDAPTIPGLFPGAAVHEGLAALEAAGLTPLEALRTATATPGKLIATLEPEAPPFGVIAVGARADMLLCSADPGRDLKALRKPLGVMAHGRWHDAEAIDALRRKVADRYASAR